MTADLRRLMKKLWKCSKYPSLYTRQRNRKKTRNFYAVRVTFHPCAVLTSSPPPKSLVTPWSMWGLMGDVIIRAQFQLNRFRG